MRLLPSACLLVCVATASLALAQEIGEEKGLPRRLADGEEFTLPLAELFAHGEDVFAANWTVQEGQGRPLTKGTGAPLADPGDPLVGARAMNRLSAPDANSCAGCHNAPFVGGSGDFVTNVFVLAQRFDFLTFDSADQTLTKGNLDESGQEVLLQTAANSRQTVGMFGSGLVEMLARQITEDLQAIRDGLAPGASAELVSKGIHYGTLARAADGSWDTSGVEGLPVPSVATSGPDAPPSLLVRPFHQPGAVVSLRQFTNNAMNHHHGIQTTERFGAGADPDGDGLTDELGIADVTAASVFQAGLDVPGRVIPSDPRLQRAVRKGEHLFVEVGCASCHVPCLPLDDEGWVYTEPSPFQPDGNLQLDDPYVRTFGTLAVDLTSPELPGPRPEPTGGVLPVFTFTDFKLHDVTAGPHDKSIEPLDMHEPAGSDGFVAGNGRFLSARLWGLANQMPFGHHGGFTTMRQAIEAHAGEASDAMAAWSALSELERGSIIEFLKTLQVLPRDAKALVVDEHGEPIDWPPFPWTCGQDVPEE